MENLNPSRKETISILGCGWYGLALAKMLIAAGYRVKGSTTSTPKLAQLKEAQLVPYLVNFEHEQTSFDEAFFDCDMLVVSIPPQSASPNLKHYPSKIKRILYQAEQQGVGQLIFISSTGIYPNGNFKVDERDIPQPDTDTGKALLAAEQVLNEAKSIGTTIIRFGGLIGPNRDLAKYFAGKKDIPNGLAPINLIHLDDCLGLTLAIIRQKAFGHIYHGVSPDHPTRASFYTLACKMAQLEQPLFVQELLAWKQIDSSNVPAILAYPFKINRWDTWLTSGT